MAWPAYWQRRIGYRKKKAGQAKPGTPQTPGQLRRGRPLRLAAADALYHAEVRAYVARRLHQGADPATIAKELGVRKSIVEGSMEHSLARVGEWEQKYGPRRGGERYPEDSPTLHGEVMDSPDEREFVMRAFALRKRAMPVDEIALETGRTEKEVRAAVARRLQELDQDEMSEASQAKRMMLEQIDAMIAAIMTPATGQDVYGAPQPVMLEAIDRMVKLFDQKAKLLGLNAPQKVDLSHRIEILARDTGYEVEELQSILADVMRDYQPAKLR